mmetsp:Transcript_104394/g.291174  ORF Transcript_104394/g.291174 Transcript_104394/m.291174 type:complete len:376 (+) Transcript_104394:219-1346(+)
MGRRRRRRNRGSGDEGGGQGGQIQEAPSVHGWRAAHALEQGPGLLDRLLHRELLRVRIAQKQPDRSELLLGYNAALRQVCQEAVQRHRLLASKGLVDRRKEFLLHLRRDCVLLCHDALLEREHGANEANSPWHKGRVWDIVIRVHLGLADHRVDLHARQAERGLVQQVANVLRGERAVHLGVPSLEEVCQEFCKFVVFELRLEQPQRGQLLQEVESKRHKLSIRYVSVLVAVNLEHDRVDLAPCKSQLHRAECRDKFLLAELPTLVLVHALEYGADKIRQLLTGHAMHKQVFCVLADVRDVLLEALLRVHSLNDLQCQGNELVVFDMAVGVHVSLGEEQVDLILGEVKPLLEVLHEVLELARVQILIRVLVVLLE